MTEDELHTLLIIRSSFRTAEHRASAVIANLKTLAKNFHDLPNCRAVIETMLNKSIPDVMSDSADEVLQFVDEQLAGYKE